MKVKVLQLEKNPLRWLLGLRLVHKRITDNAKSKCKVDK